MSLANKNNLNSRVLDCRIRLRSMGVKMPRHFFTLKYPEYRGDDDKLNNLWYGKIDDDDFTSKLESFTEFKKVQYK
jgi:hypothetical protein